MGAIILLPMFLVFGAIGGLYLTLPGCTSNDFSMGCQEVLDQGLPSMGWDSPQLHIHVIAMLILGVLVLPLEYLWCLFLVKVVKVKW